MYKCVHGSENMMKHRHCLLVLYWAVFLKTNWLSSAELAACLRKKMSNLHFKCMTTDQVVIAGTECKCNFSLFRPVCIYSVDIHGRLCLVCNQS